MAPPPRKPIWPALLFLLAAGAAQAAPFFNVLDFGAHNDGSAPSTAAFRGAIQAAKAAGGGTVFVPAGRYVTGPIELVSNLVLNLDAGAVIQFPATVLPFTEGREQGIECLTPVPLIGGRHLENVTITGRGELTTNNADWLKLMSRSQASGSDPGSAFGPAWEHLLQSLERKTPATRAEYLAAAPELRPSFVRVMDSKNVLIEGVHFVGSSMWTIHLLYSDNVVVRDVIIETYPGVHTDGIGIDSSRNVRIANCYIDTGDDGIVLKAGKDADGRRVNRPTENISITNCTVHHAHGAVTIGSETSGGIRNVVASNFTCDGTQEGVRIKSRRGRGGVVEDLRFDNWTMRNVGMAIDVTNYYLMEGEVRTSEEPVSGRTPLFRDIAISHMTVQGARTAIAIDGLPEMPIAWLRISDVIASADAGMSASHTVGLQLRDVQINAKHGPAFRVEDAQDLELADVSTRQPLPGQPVIRLDRAPGTIVRDSRAYAGTGTFLSVAPGGLKEVTLIGNVLGAAAQPTVEGAPGAPAAKAPAARVIDQELQAAVARHDIPGVVALAWDQQGVLYEGAFGVAESQANRPLTMDAIFRIASMTKAVTSVALMQLVEQGRVALDDPAEKYLPELANPMVFASFDPQTHAYQLRPAASAITVRQLLTHTSGLAYPFTSAVIRDFVPRPGEHYAVGPLLFDPGTQWIYSKGVDVIGQLVEKVSGQTLEAFFQKNIFGPLGLHDTFYNVPPEKEARVVNVSQRLPDGRFQEAPRSPFKPVTKFGGGGGLYSTAADYLRFLRMFLNRGELDGARILSRDTVALMIQNQIGPVGVRAVKTALPDHSSDFSFIADGRDKWGIGFMITTDAVPGKRSAGSLSWGGIDNTYYWWDPARGVAGVILMQFLPFADRKALAVYDQFERGVYQLAGPP